MVAALLAANPRADVAAAVVWLPMIAGDSEAAVPAAAALVPDARAANFYDPHHHAGRAIAASIGAASEVAWDMYLFYDPVAAATPHETTDTAALPRPALWFHQLRGREWAGPDHYRWGEDLAHSLSDAAAACW